MTGLVFLHGWGFGPEAWDGWRSAFPERPTAVLSPGYFGPASMELPRNPEDWIGVGHSLGFARLLGMNLPWRGLIGLGAFLHFCQRSGEASSEPGTGTPPAVIEAMLARLAVDPADVLTRFLRRCGIKGRAPTTPTPEGLARLDQDLRVLRGVDLRPEQPLPPILLLHAADDRIVAPALAREAQSLLPGARLTVLETGGHALPFTSTGACLGPVREFLHARG